MGCGARQEPWHGAVKLFYRRDQAFFWRTTGDCLLSGSRQPRLQSRNRRDAMVGVCPGCLRATGGRAVASGGSSPNFVGAAAWCALCLASAALCPYSARTVPALCPYSPAFSISPVLPGFFDASLCFGSLARLTLLCIVCRARLRLCFAVPRGARTGAGRHGQAQAVPRRCGQAITGANRCEQARFEVKPFGDRVFDVSAGAR